MTHTPPTPHQPQKFLAALVTLSVAAFGAACSEKPPDDRVRVSGQVEATDVQVAAQVGGRPVKSRRSTWNILMAAGSDQADRIDLDRPAKARSTCQTSLTRLLFHVEH